MTSVRGIQQALNSGLSALTAGVVEGQQQVAESDFPLAATEMIQRIQIPCEGFAASDMVWTEVDVTWPYPIINQMAGNQHESTQETPHFNYGVELLTDDHVWLDAVVRSWSQDASDFYVGAKVRIAAWAPASAKTVSYKSVLHLTFMGYAAAAEDDDDSLNPDHLVT